MNVRTPMTPTTEGLPFLVVHGGWFWILMVVVGVVVLAGIVALARRVTATLRARAVIALQRADLVSTLAEGDTVLAGQWHRDRLRVGEERVLLGDDRRIVLGSRGDQIDDGAAVIVRGKLAPVADTSPETAGGYRENAGAWRIDGAEIYATRPRVRAAPLSWPARIVWVLVAIGVSYAGLRAVGLELVERWDVLAYKQGDGHPLYIGELDTISIAASLPGSREMALEHLASALELHPYRDDESVRRQLGLDRLLHGSCGNLRIVRARPDEQLAVARRCGYDHELSWILIRLGEYEAAWQRLPPHLELPHVLGMVAIARRDWSAAAEQADKMADRSHRRKSGTPSERALWRSKALRYRCLAQWFRTLAGEAGGGEKLQALAAAPGNPPVVCAPIVAQTLPAGERAAYLRHATAAVPDDAKDLERANLVAELALWLEGDGDLFDRSGFDILRGAGDGEMARYAWLFQFGVERWRGSSDPRQAALALSGVVLREVHRGDFAAARRAAEEAIQLAQPLRGTYAWERVRSWSTIVALREGRELPPPGAVDGYADVFKLRRGQAPEFGLMGYPESCDSLLRSGVESAQRGDGRPLAIALQSCTVSGFGLRTLLGVLPLVRQGQRELAARLRWWGEPLGMSVFEPFASVAYAAAQRDLARFVGDEESAKMWGQLAKRLVAPLEDRTRTLALVLWNE